MSEGFAFLASISSSITLFTYTSIRAQFPSPTIAQAAKPPGRFTAREALIPVLYLVLASLSSPPYSKAKFLQAPSAREALNKKSLQTFQCFQRSSRRSPQSPDVTVSL